MAAEGGWNCGRAALVVRPEGFGDPSHACGGSQAGEAFVTSVKRMLMKRIVILASLLFLHAARVAAQPIHGHPQKAAYASPAEWPWVSAQCHWSPADSAPGSMPESLLVGDLRLGLLGTARLGHTHIEVDGFPLYSEIEHATTFTGRVVAFHVQGRIEDLGVSNRGGQRGTVVWNETGTSTPPTMIGDPDGMRSWSFTATVWPDPTFPHGWYNVFIDAFTQFDNADSIRPMLLLPVYSVVDRSAPESGEVVTLEGNCNGGSPRRPEILNGTTIARIQNDKIPIAPYFQKWPATINSLGYGTLSEIPVPASLEQRIDMDLHHGIGGKSLMKMVGATAVGSPVGAPITFEPSVLGNGKHRVALIRTQPDGGLEGVTSLLLFDVTVDPTAPVVTVPTTPAPPPPTPAPSPTPAPNPPPAPGPTPLPAAKTCPIDPIVVTVTNGVVKVTGGTMRCGS